MQSQLLYVIPIMLEIGRLLGIKRVIFEQGLPKNVLSNKTVLQTLKDFEVSFLDTKYRNKNITIIFHDIFKYGILKFIKLYLNSTRSKILRNKDWYEIQLRHSVFDSANVKVKDGCINIPIFIRLRSTLQVINSVLIADYLISENVIVAYSGHMVYQHRSLIASLRKANVRLFSQEVGPSIYELNKNYDSNQYFYNKENWEKLSNRLNNKMISQFWELRSNGFSNYQDADNARKGKTYLSKDYPTNIVFLHVFKDSPFNIIDPKRIFPDYISWVIETLKIIRKCNEKWVLRLHPTSKRWGENSMVWLESIFKLTNTSLDDSNIIVDSSKISNVTLLKHCKRIVSYCGNVHLEAACHGVRPIIISECTLSFLNNNLVFKPLSLKEYENLILSDTDDKFILNKNDVYLARKILYLREEVLNFGKELAGLTLYRSDGSKLLSDDFNIVFNKVNQNQHYISYLSKTILKYGKTFNSKFSNQL